MELVKHGRCPKVNRAAQRSLPPLLASVFFMAFVSPDYILNSSSPNSIVREVDPRPEVVEEWLFNLIDGSNKETRLKRSLYRKTNRMNEGWEGS